MLKGHSEHLQILKNGGLTDIIYMPYLYKSIVYGDIRILLETQNTT